MEYILMKNISYFSYDGILEPLGNSQVLNYLIILSKKYKITLFTFEKLKDINDTSRLIEMKNLCNEHSIVWKYSIFNEEPIASNFNPVKYFLFIFRNYFNISNVIHARSFIPSCAAYLISKIKINSKFIYDMRGYWIDEKVDVEKFKRNSLIYIFLKWLDRKIIKNATHIVTLSNISRIYLQNNYNKNPDCITTIYTCTDLNKFKLFEKKYSEICFGYVGTTIGWYQFEETLDFIKLAFDAFPNSTFKIITRDNKQELLKRITKKNIDITKIIITSSNFEKIQEEYKDLDIAVFFIKKSFSKTASMPTKFGEFLASGIPCIVNSEIGDMTEIIKENPICGFVINDFSNKEYQNIINHLYLLTRKENSLECRKVAEKYFSLDKGASSYSIIYEKI
jgi:glycosyltransferase involved in cell wall biosynthesis